MATYEEIVQKQNNLQNLKSQLDQHKTRAADRMAKLQEIFASAGVKSMQELIDLNNKKVIIIF